MEHHNIALLIPMISVIALCITIIYLRKYRNQERMSMIDKGINPTDMAENSNNYGTLRFSLLAIGVGTGLFLGYFLDRLLTNMEEVAYFSMIFLFGGLGLGLAHYIEEKKINEEKNGNTK